MSLSLKALRVSEYMEGADGKVARLEISVHRWRLGVEVAFNDGWAYLPWRRRFRSVRLMLVWWHVMLCRRETRP
jgi:hypothetical protein